MKSLEFPSKRLAVVLALLALTPSLLADQTWNGTSDNLWTTPANWSGSAAPASTDNVAYNATSTGNLSNWLSQAFSIKGILFTNPAGPVSINSDSTLTLGASGINLSNATQPLTISAPVALGASNVWVVANNQSLQVSGVLSGASANGIYKDGFGTLYLSGTNTFTGGLTDNGGQIWLNNNAALGGGGSTRNITIANNSVGAGLHLNGTNGNLSLPSILQFILSQNQGAIFNEAGDNVIPGNIYVTSGGGDAYFVVNAGTLTLKGPIQSNAGARALELGGAGNGTNNGIISTVLSLRKMDGGTWTLTNNNTYTGATTVEGGTLDLAATAKIGGTPSITVFDNATLDVSAVVTSGTNAFALTTGQILAGGGTVTGSVDASAANVAIQPGSLDTHGTTGGMGAAGTLSISGNLAMGPSTTNYFELGPSTTPGGGVNDLINVGGDLDPQNAYISIGTVNGLVNGTYRLFNYTGAKLSSFNPACATSFRGTFTIDESVPNQINLIVSGVINPVWTGTGSSSTWDLNTTADWNGNTLKFLNGDSVTFDDTGVAPRVNISGTLQPGSVTFNNSTLISYTLAVPTSGKITGPVGLTKSGSGTLTITANACDYTGPVTINGGTLTVTNLGLIGSASALGAGASVILNGGTLQCSAPGNIAPAQFNRSFVLGASGGTLSVGTSGYLYVTNTISGPGSLTTKVGGTQQLIVGNASPVAGVNTYMGNTYITQGEVQIRNANALGWGKVVVSGGADLAVGGGGNYGTMTNDIDLNSVIGSDRSSNGALRIGDTGSGMTFAGTITLLSNSSFGSQSTASGLTFNISGPIVGSGSLTKMQASTAPITCTLGGTNTFTGNTIVSAGTLAVGLGGVGAISNSPNISVASGAKLQLNAGALLGSTVNISLAAGGYMDVNGLGAGSTYTLGAGATLNASGTGTTSGTTQAEIHGNATGTVSLGAPPISLTFTPTVFTGDTTHPPLVISQGALQLSGNVITVNNAAGTALGAGTYRLIQVTSGTTSGTPNATPFVAGKGLAANMTASLSVSSGNVILTVSSTSPTATTTTLGSLTASPYGSPVTFTATVSPTPAGGTVQFYDNGVAIGSPAAVGGDGTASLTTSALWAGNHPISAAYSGASGSAASATASSSSQVVSAVPLTVTATDDSKSYGQTKAYGAGSTAFTSSGLQNGDVIASVTITSSGGAANASVGTYSLTPSAAVGGAFNANNYVITYNNGTLTVSDTTAPVISCPADISVVTTNSTGADVSFTVTATDNYDPSPTVVSSPASGSFFPAGTNTVTAYAYDASGNTNTCSFLVMVDRAPVVQSSVSAYPQENELLTLDLAKLLAVVSDPDNDPLSVIAAGPTSTNGGTVTLTSTNVTYQPVADFVGTDLFDYTVSDGRGGLATNTVLVTVLSSNGLSPNVVYGPVVSNGLFIVRFAGIPGYTYTVEATDDIGSPSWTKKTNLTAPVTDQGLGVGIFEFSESVGDAGSRFYRTVYPSY